MTADELRLAAKLLRIASERFARHVCNDFDLQKDGEVNDPEMWKALCEEAERRNRTPQDFDPNQPPESYRTYLPDRRIMDVMASKLEDQAKEALAT